LDFFAHVFDIFARTVGRAATTRGGQRHHDGGQEDDYDPRYDGFQSFVWLHVFIAG
jgi:hypothetical protein